MPIHPTYQSLRFIPTTYLYKDLTILSINITMYTRLIPKKFF